MRALRSRADRRRPRDRAPAQHRRKPAGRSRSRSSARPRPERRAPGDAARGGRAPAAAAGEIQLRLRRAGRLPLGDVEADIRFEASQRRDARRVSRRRRRAGRAMRAGEAGDVAARLGLAFLALPGDGEAAPRRMRALIERTGAAVVFAEARLRDKAERAVRNDAPCCVTSSARANSARRASSARRRPSAKSTRFGSRR